MFPLKNLARKELINKSHISHKAPVLYTTMHHFVTEMCTFLLHSGALRDICVMHSAFAKLYS